MVDQKINSLYDMISSPSYGLSQFQRMGASQSGSLSDYLGMARARGGSFVQAQEQFEASKKAAQSGAYDAWRGFSLDKQGSLMDLLGMQSERDMFGRQLAFQKRQAYLDRKTGFYNSLINMAGNIAGSAVGGGL